MKLKIHTKIALIFTMVSALILCGVFLYLNKNLRAYGYENIRSELQKKSAFAKTHLESLSLENAQPDRYDRLADRMGEDLQLRATIIGLDGAVLGDSDLEGRALRDVENHLDRPEIQAALQSGWGESRRYSTTVNKNMLYRAMRFERPGGGGIVRLSLPLSEIEGISARLKGITAVSLAAAFALAVFINILASAFISKPIREMSKTAQRIAKGDFSNIPSTASNDEIGDLAKAFNTMSEQLKVRLEESELSRSRLEAVLLNMLEGVLVVDAKGAISLMNPALLDFFHIQTEVRGKNAIEVIRNLDISEIIDCALKDGCRLDPCEISLFSPEDRTLSVYATPVFRNGRQEGAILVFHDNTNVRRLEKIRQDFVANVSHELKTPIASIQGYAETLLEGALDDRAHALDFIETIFADAKCLANLVNDLLNLSKIESGKLDMDIKATALPPVILRVVRSMEAQAERKSMILATQLPEPLPQVLADEARLAQVLFNLVDNAIKYTPEGGRIALSAADQGGMVAIRVSDTGIGIPEDEQPRIFERFYRVDKGRSRALGGTGLGLSIVKHIIKAHNGDIHVESALGKGSAFTFTLPKSS